MARKHNSSRAPKPRGPRSLDPADSKINPINTWEDVADEEDSFHIARDKVLLDSDDERRRRFAADDDFGEPSDEEVLELSEDDSEEEVEDEEEEGEEEEAEEEEVQEIRQKRKAGDLDSDDDSDDGRDSEEDVEGWGTSKKSYYGGNAIETEQDALDEEKEAKRLQSKQLSGMNAADFLFDEEEWVAAAEAEERSKEQKNNAMVVVTESLPTSLPEGVAERMKLLKARHPEFDPLAKEFLELQPMHASLGLSSAAAEAVGETVRTSVAIAKFTVLSTYLGVLSMYFAVLTAPEVVKTQGMALRDHAVMEGLVKCRKTWNTVKDLEVEEITCHKLEAKAMKTKKQAAAAPAILPKKTKSDQEPERERKRAKLEKDAKAAAALTKAAEEKVTKAQKLEDSLADLEALTTLKYSRKPSTSKPAIAVLNDDDDDFGDETHLTTHDAQEKALRRKNLRFYTSQIVSKSSKRTSAGRDAGGDIDIPHRERNKEKQLRLSTEAAKRRGEEGADLDDADFNEEDTRAAKAVVAADDPDNEYYNLIANASKKQKETKKKTYEAIKDAKRAGHGEVVTIEVGKDGSKRAIGYTIEKNKGLTPHRKKDVRNPRVKKRKKYEAAKKKLGSTKAVYKGGLQGAYGGEATGIKKNLVKSVKFA